METTYQNGVVWMSNDHYTDGTARCRCGWEVEASTKNQAEAAAVGHSYDTGHSDLEINGRSLHTESDRDENN